MKRLITRVRDKGVDRKKMNRQLKIVADSFGNLTDF